MENYDKYGEAWKKEMAKLPKSVIINLASNIGKDKEALHAELEKAKELLKRVKVWGAEHGLNMEIYTDINTFLEAK